MKSNFFSRIRRSILKRWLTHLGYPKNHIIHHFFDGIRVDPIYKERPLSYNVYHNNKKITTQSLYSFKDSLIHPEEIFIIGSGPSIKQQPIELLSSRKTILLNGAIQLVKTHRLNPIGIVIIDDSFIRKHVEMLNAIPPSTHLFLSFFALKEIIKNSPHILQNPIYLVHELKFVSDSIPKDLQQKIEQFDKPTWGVFDGGTVMSVAIQIAAFIKAQNIYLLGLDIGNSNTEPRFYEEKNNICRSSLLTDYDKKILPFMKLAAEWCARNNINIFNCSPVSKVPYEIIPFKDIDEIIKKQQHQTIEVK